MTIEVGQTGLVLVCDQSSLVDLCMQDYNCMYVAVMICSTGLTSVHTQMAQ